MTPELKARRLNARRRVNGKLVHPDAPHGTWGGYTNWFCRCERCCAANTAGMRAYLDRKAQEAAS